MQTRREIIKSGLGLAGIIAAGKAPAALVRSLIAARSAMVGGGNAVSNVPYFDVNPSKANNAAWFDTGLVATNSTRIEMCVAFTEENRSFLSCGRRDKWPPTKGYQLHINGRYSRSCYIAWNSNNSEVSLSYYTPRGVFSVYQGKLYYNGDVVRTYSGTLADSNLTMWFCNINQNGNPADNGLYGRFYWGKVYENEVLTHHYIPQSDLTVKDIVGGGTIQKSGASQIEYGEELT
jgi:hypothetical protein